MIWILLLTLNAQSFTRDLTVSNQMADDICSLYVSPETSGDWGKDYLGFSKLKRETRRRFEIESTRRQCVFDVRVDPCLFPTVEHTINLCITNEWTATEDNNIESDSI